MPLDAKLIGFSTAAVQAFTIANGMTNVTNNGVTVGGKSAVTATDATGTNWLVMPDLDQIGQSIPEDGLTLSFFFSAGTGAGGGNTGTFLFTPTVAFSDDASTVKSSRVLAPITGTVTAGVMTPFYAQAPFGWVANHKYWRVNWTIALTTITSLSLTTFTIGWENEADSGIGRVGNNIS